MTMFTMSIYVRTTAPVPWGLPSKRRESSHFMARNLGCTIHEGYMTIYALCAAAVTFSSRSRAQILSARILNYCYVGMERSVVPGFQAEIVPREVRGLIVETYQLMLYLGGLIMSLICRGTSELEGNKQWQIPSALFFIIPAIVAACIRFIPEASPVLAAAKL